MGNIFNPILKKFNEMINENLAKLVIEKYRDDPEGLTYTECSRMEELGLPEGKCGVLQEVLRPGLEGVITPEEQQKLADEGFAKEFIKTLAGTDGKKALRARVKWLSQQGLEKFDETEKHRFVRTATTFLKEELGHCECEQAARALGKIDAAAIEEADAALAEEVIKYRVEWPGGIARNCAKMQINDKGCEVLQGVLGRGPWAMVTSYERQQLADAGFGKNFIKTLAGDDGKRVLRAEIEYLVKKVEEEHGDEKTTYYFGGFYAKQLANFGSEAKDAIPILTRILKRALKGKKTQQSKALVEALGRFGPNARGAVPILAEALLGSGNPDVEDAAASALGETGPAAVPILTEALEKGLKDKNIGLIKAAAGELGHIGPNAKDAIPVLAKALRDNDSRVRFAVSMALSEIGPAAIPTLTKIIKNKRERPEVRKEAIDVLGPMKIVGHIKADVMAAAPVLIGLVKDKGENPDMRKHAILKLRRIGADAKIVVPALITVLKDKDEDSGLLFLQVTRYLGIIGPKARAAIPYLMKAWIEYEGWRRQIAKALERICSPKKDGDASTDAKTAKPEEEISPAVIRAFVGEWENTNNRLRRARQTSRWAFSALIEGLGSENEAVREYATRELGEIGAAAPHLREALNHKNPTVRKNARRALRRLTLPRSNSY